MKYNERVKTHATNIIISLLWNAFILSLKLSTTEKAILGSVGTFLFASISVLAECAYRSHRNDETTVVPAQSIAAPPPVAIAVAEPVQEPEESNDRSMFKPH